MERVCCQTRNPTPGLPFFSKFPAFSLSKSKRPPAAGVSYRPRHMASSNSTSSSSGESQGVVGGDLSALQKHVAFFDLNKDGIVYPWETYKGFRAIGCGILLSAASAFLINLALSRKTRPGKSPSLLFPIEIKNIHRAKHGSDSGVYDNEGRFVPAKFEEIFTKHAHANSTALTSEELQAMLKVNREPKDYAGWVGSWTEWKILYFLCKDEKGLLHKETVRAVYDGTLFERMKEERDPARKKAARSDGTEVA